MVIKKSVLRAYEARETDDFSWIKELSRKELEAALDDLPQKPHFHTKPYNHQLASFILGYYCPELLVFLDPGLGKTWVCLNMVKYRKQLGEPHRTFVAVPFRAAVQSWVDEVALHTPDLSVCPLRDSDNVLQAITDGKHDVYVATYAAMARLMCNVKGTPKGKWRIHEPTARKVKEAIDFLSVDEIHNFANKSSLYWRCANRIAKDAETRIGLTGTPFGRDPEELWAQFYLMDRGETLGPTLGFFREVFYTSKRGFWGNTEYTFQKRKKKLLYNIIKHRSILYEDKECGDVPQKLYIPKHVQMPKASLDIYERLLDEFLDNVKTNTTVARNSFTRMRQLASGFLYYKDEDGQRHEMVFPENPKMEALLEVIQSLPENAKLIVFHEFVYTGTLISKKLKSLKIPHCTLGGRQRDGDEQVKRFQTDPKYRVFVVNNAAGGSSLNLQVANRTFYFETPTEPKRRKQTEKRTDRIGQKSKRVYYYDAIMLGTKDAQILKSLQSGKDFVEEIMKGGVDA